MFDIFYLDQRPTELPWARPANSIQHAQSLSNTRYFWIATYLADYSDWDWLWEPPPWQSHQRHAWASQWQPDSGTYLVPRTGYQDTNYHTWPQILRLPDPSAWHIPRAVDPNSFDWSWHPNPLEPDFEYHFGTQWQCSGGPIYPGTAGIKLCTDQRALVLPDRNHWWIPDHIDDHSIDFSWHPSLLEPPAVYHFDAGRGWHNIGGPEYRVPGAIGVKYIQDLAITTRGDPQCWYIPDWIDPASIDTTWCPNPSDPAYIYEFPVEWGWDHVGGPEYRVPGARERKYVTDFVARTRPDPSNFEVLDHLDPHDDVFRWRPNPRDPAYVYVFGNQWWSAEQRASAVYRVPGATEIKYMSEPRARRLAVPEHYRILAQDAEFDQSWEPDPGDPAYIYVFGNQWHPPEIMPTVEYHVPGAEERKFMDHPRAQLTATHDDLWKALVPCSWDRTWTPDPGDPPYIYVFGNQWHPGEIMPTLEYHVPGATQRKFVADVAATLPPSREFWHIPEDVDAEAIDYSWCPDPGDPPYVYHFGSEHQTSVGVTYTVPGAQEIKFAGDIPLIDRHHKAMIESAAFFIDFGNPLSAQRFQELQARLPDLERVRYVNSMLDTLRRCARRSDTPRFWAVSSHNDYRDFDFSWHPETWQRGMIHVFGTQWNKWSDTLLVNRWEFERQSPWQTQIGDFYNLNFVSNQRVTAATDAADIIVVDHGNAERDRVIADLGTRPGRVVRTARYFDNYLDTLRRVIDDSTQSQHVWICSTLCDYREFDFSWQPEVWQRDMIHVFASGNNKFGDTFLVPVDAWRQQQNKLELLDWFDTVHYVADISVPRWPMPVIRHSEDTHVQQIQHTEFTAPLMLFTVSDQRFDHIPTVSIWRERTETIVPLDSGAESVIVPRRAVASIRTQLYDYAHIDRTHRSTYSCSPLDIVFISHGEANAERNWVMLQESVSSCPNQIHRIDGVTGRVAAYQAAAQVSATPWFFAVFAKLEINADFDWAWQPDRMQQPKHYIFHARNPVTGLVYGHQAMIAYNRDLVMSNTGSGLDFTLDQPHEVVPVISGTAWYADSAWMAWRTAFREALKLRHSLPDVENQYRLQQWLAPGQGVNSEWSQRGAEDAVEYYDSVGGDFTALRKSYEWAWLSSYALLRRNLTPDQ
jgi:hypothetical protein